MKTFVSGACTIDNLYALVDPSTFTEEVFEAHTIAALRCVYPEYHCIPFRGGFAFDENTHEADLALIHKSYSHWYILEVELVSHSLQHHVLPQVRSFRFGKPLESCLTYLCNHLPSFDIEQAQSLLRFVPRGVAVVANRYEQDWSSALGGCDVQLVTVSVFKRHDGQMAHEIDGSLYIPHVSLGFFRYLAPERSIRLSHGHDFAEGPIQIQDPYDVTGVWIVRNSPDGVWITKEVGDPGIPHNSLLQVLRTQTGKITMRLPGAAGGQSTNFRNSRLQW